MSQEPQSETKTKGKTKSASKESKNESKEAPKTEEQNILKNAELKDSTRIFESTQARESEVSKALEKIASGPVARQGEVEGIYVLDYSLGVVRKRINELGLKQKLKVRSQEHGKSKPVIVARLS